MAAGERQLVAVRAGAALDAVQLGEVEQQVAAVGAERVESADLGEPFGDGPARAGPLPEVEQGGVGLPGLDAGGFGLADAVDVGQGEPQPPHAGGKG